MIKLSIAKLTLTTRMIMLKTPGWCESYETTFFSGNMPKLFCPFRVGLKSAIYGTSKLLLALHFFEVLLIIVQVKTSIRNIKQ